MKTTTASLLALLAGFYPAASYATSTPAGYQLGITGVTSAIQSQANGGQGITIAIVDTGINPAITGFAGRISSLSTCVATNNCKNGYADDFGHGTFVASIAAGGPGNAYISTGVAPKATIMAVKISQPGGTAYTTDEDNGVMTAARNGAKVINLSFGSFFAPRDTSAYAVYNAQMVNAINVAASYGATVVIAGGNSSTTFMQNVNQGGFTSTALSHLIFAGATTPTSTLSSYSNTPGTSNFLATNGQSKLLESLWIMAPGDNLQAAWYQGNGYYAIGSGTSFSAPQVSGALALLEARWPVLYRNGTATQLLLSTTTDLGAKGTDTTYGTGMMNVTQAFQPVGNLTITNAKGQAVNVSTITGSMLASGAFGSMSSLTSQLKNMTALDSYSRDFPVDLSSLVTTSKAASLIVSQVTAPTISATKAHFADGSSFAFGESSASLTGTPSGYDTPAKQRGWYMSITDNQGSTLAAGKGFPAAASFAEAMWGSDSLASDSVNTLGISNSLMGIAEGGPFTAYGKKIGDNTRIAFSWSQTENTYDPMAMPSQSINATAAGAGLTTRLSDQWTTGVTLNSLSESNGLLGSTYGNSSIGLGNQHNSFSVGVTASYDVTPKTNLTFDAAWVRSDGADIAGGLISHVSDVYARSMGAALTQSDAFHDDDKLSFALRMPLQVYAGSADLNTMAVDSNGFATTTTQRVNLAADGQETDLSVNYAAPWKMGVNWTASFEARHDADNIRGNQAADILVGARLSF
ncbi:MAG: S8 family serine peptidase [Alphaproteobacteria bacterium]|nr:S8 family serine peptidase [Alphaproteobacteria bacterium]